MIQLKALAGRTPRRECPVADWLEPGHQEESAGGSSREEAESEFQAMGDVTVLGSGGGQAGTESTESPPTLFP